MKYLNEVSTPELIKLIKQNLATKQDLITSPVNNNLAGMDSTGQTIDSGISTDTIKDNIYDTKSYTDQSFLYRESLSEEDCVGKLDTIKGNSLVFNQKVWKEENANILKIKGNTIKFNQLAEPLVASFSLSPVNFVNNGDGSFTVNGTAGSSNIDIRIDQTARVGTDRLRSYSAGKYYVRCSNFSGIDHISIMINNVWSEPFIARQNAIVNINSPVNDCFMIASLKANYTFSNYKFTVELFNLTAMGIDNLTTVEQVETWLSNNIGLLPYYDYTPGTLIPFNGTGLETYKSIWDNQLYGGYYNDTSFNLAGNVNSYKSIKFSAKANTKYVIRFSKNVKAIRLIINGNDFYSDRDSELADFLDTKVMAFTPTVNCDIGLSFRVPGQNWDNTITIRVEEFNYVLNLPILTLFPTGMKDIPNADVYDELTESEATTRIAEIVYDGSSDENWQRQTGTYNFFEIYRTDVLSDVGCVADKMEYYYIAARNTNVGVGTSGNGIRLRYEVNNSLTVEDLRTWLANNPIKIFYALKVPTSQDISLDLTYPVWDNGTEQILPINSSTPTTTSMKATIDYPDGIEEAEFLYKQTLRNIVLTDGHSYITKINGTWSNVSGTGQTLSVGDDDMVIDLTQMANPYITNYSQFTQFYPDTYEFEKGRLISFVGTGLMTTSADESESSTLTLPTYDGGLKSAGNAYDELNESKYIKRIGVVDLGSLNFNYNTTNACFIAEIPTKHPTNRGNLICSLYVYGGVNTSISQMASAPNMTIWDRLQGSPSSYSWIVIKNTSYTDEISFKTAMSGVYLYYELATPIETEATTDLVFDAYKDGTEEILSTSTTTPATSPIVTDMSYLGTKDTIDLSYDLLKEAKEEIGVLELNSIYYGNETAI